MITQFRSNLGLSILLNDRLAVSNPEHDQMLVFVYVRRLRLTFTPALDLLNFSPKDFSRAVLK